MAFGILRLYSSSEPQKLIDVTNEHLDKHNVILQPIIDKKPPFLSPS